MDKKGKFNILVSSDYYRVNIIQKFDKEGVKDLDISEGLAIEAKIDDDYYVVVNYIKPKDEGPIIENIGLRPMNTLKLKDNETIQDYFERIQEYYNCLGFAVTALADLKK